MFFGDFFQSHMFRKKLGHNFLASSSSISFQEAVKFDFFQHPQVINSQRLIFVIFSPPIQFLAQFLSTQKRVNRDKTDYGKNSVNCHKTDFTNKKQGKYQISSQLSFGEFWNSSKFGKISDFSTSVVWKIWNSSKHGEISVLSTSVMQGYINRGTCS